MPKIEDFDMLSEEQKRELLKRPWVRDYLSGKIKTRIFIRNLKFSKGDFKTITDSDLQYIIQRSQYEPSKRLTNILKEIINFYEVDISNKRIFLNKSRFPVGRFSMSAYAGGDYVTSGIFGFMFENTIVHEIAHIYGDKLIHEIQDEAVTYLSKKFPLTKKAIWSFLSTFSEHLNLEKVSLLIRDKKFTPKNLLDEFNAYVKGTICKKLKISLDMMDEVVELLGNCYHKKLNEGFSEYTSIYVIRRRKFYPMKIIHYTYMFYEMAELMAKALFFIPEKVPGLDKAIHFYRKIPLLGRFSEGWYFTGLMMMNKISKKYGKKGVLAAILASSYFHEKFYKT